MKYDGKTITRRLDRKNTWLLRFRYNNKQYTVYGKTQKEVIKNYKDKQKELDSNSKNILNYHSLTLSEYFEEYLKLYKINKVTETTILKTRSDFKLHLKPLHKLNLIDITQYNVQECINAIKYPCARKNAFILINAIMQKAFINNLVPTNVVKIVDRPVYKAKQNIALTKEEEKLFIEECKNFKTGDFYLLCLYQGLRKGECRALKVNDVDFTNMTLRIDESINVHTKLTNTKNQQSNRVMPIFNKSIDILKRNITDKNPNDYIFSIGSKKIDNNIIEIYQKLNIRKISNHTLRHTFITRCQETNIPIYVVQSWVGHEKGSVVTTKIYTHLNEETNKKYTNIMNNIKLD